MAEDESADGRSTRTNALWADTRIDPVEIALPGGVGYTLRAYRPASEVATPETDRNEEADDFDAASAAVARRRRTDDAEEDEAEAAEAEDDDEVAELTDEEIEAELEAIAEDEEADERAANEDVPLFLGRKGKVFLFHSTDKLVEFVRSGAEHDLSQLDTWPDVVKRVRTEDVAPVDDDRYELDLVVENLRGGPDAWDAGLILKAGEIARDIGFALRIEPVMVALAAGSPLDDLDEALRSSEAGGMGSFFARRRLKKIPAQQSSLAWRTIIGKISAAADWRD